MTTQTPKPRAVLHFGPPKTATSALQAWCHVNRCVLARHGLHYGTVDTPHDPKHQWVMRALRQGDFARLQAEIAAFHDSPAHTLILSCEGVMVHRATVPAAHWQAFRQIMEGIDSTLFMVGRDPESWLASLWKQRIINPIRPGERLKVMTPQAFARLAGVQAMLDLPRLATVMQQETGAGRTVFSRLPTMLDDFRAVLRLPPEAETQDLPRANEALPDSFIDVYLRVAEAAPDVPLVRMAFFGLFVAAHPTNNVVLSNVARRFQTCPEDQRRAALDMLLVVLDGITFTEPADAALAQDMRQAALARA
ncbi:hypothetical protein [Paracoccus laeviglucosivorans]|nr:hypothetical protein [Paracoccus laeviglucosivorans]